MSGSYNGGGTIFRIGSCSAVFKRSTKPALSASSNKKQPVANPTFNHLSVKRRRFVEEAARAEFAGLSVQIPAGMKIEIEKHGSLAKWIAADFVRKAAYDNWINILSGKHKISRHKK